MNVLKKQLIYSLVTRYFQNRQSYMENPYLLEFNHLYQIITLQIFIYQQVFTQKESIIYIFPLSSLESQNKKQMFSKMYNKYVQREFKYAKDQRLVFQKDQRQKVSDTSIYPYNIIGLLIVEFYNPLNLREPHKLVIGTASILNSRLILTSAHNFYLRNFQILHESIFFCPEYPRRSKNQRYQIKITKFTINQKYYDFQNPNSCKYDIALAVLQQNQIIPKQLRVNIDWDYCYWKSSKNIINISGYNFNKECKIWQLYNSEFDSELQTNYYHLNQFFLHYKNTTLEGYSGAPVFIKRLNQNGEIQYVMVAVHKAGLATTNIGVILNQHKQTINQLIEKLNLPQIYIPQFYSPSHKKQIQGFRNLKHQYMKLLEQLSIIKQINIQLIEQNNQKSKIYNLQFKELQQQLKQQKQLYEKEKLQKLQIQKENQLNRKKISQMEQKHTQLTKQLQKLKLKPLNIDIPPPSPKYSLSTKSSSIKQSPISLLHNKYFFHSKSEKENGLLLEENEEDFIHSQKYGKALSVDQSVKLNTFSNEKDLFVSNKKDGYEFVKQVLFKCQEDTHKRYEKDPKTQKILLNLQEIQFDMEEFLKYQWMNLQKLNLQNCQIEQIDLLLANGQLFPSLKTLNLGKTQKRELNQQDFHKFNSLTQINFGKYVITICQTKSKNYSCRFVTKKRILK